LDGVTQRRLDVSWTERRRRRLDGVTQRRLDVLWRVRTS